MQAAEYRGGEPHDGLLEILGVAEFTLAADEVEPTDVPGLFLEVARSSLERCDRCRRRRVDVTSADDATLCDRCEPWRDARVEVAQG